MILGSAVRLTWAQIWTFILLDYRLSQDKRKFPRRRGLRARACEKLAIIQSVARIGDSAASSRARGRQHMRRRRRKKLANNALDSEACREQTFSASLLRLPQTTTMPQRHLH